jgi:hypothetical protein
MSTRGGTVLLTLVCAAALGTPILADAAEPTKEQCVASNEKAQDLRRTGKLLDARAQLAVCVSGSCPGPVREDCAQRLADIDAAIPAIVFEVKDPTGNDLAAVRVIMDGRPLVDRLDGTALALDPGEHKFVFRSEGHKRTERTFVLRERDKARREKIVLEVETTPGPPEPATTQPTSVAPMPWPTVAPTSTATTASTAETPAGGGRRVSPLVFVAGGVALVGLGIGIGTGVAAGSKHDALSGECNGNDCPPSAQGDLDSFHSLKTVSTIGYVVGFVGLAAGAAFFFFLPGKSPAAAARVWVGPGSAGIGGAF